MKVGWMLLAATLAACTEGEGQLDVSEVHVATFPAFAATGPLQSLMAQPQSVDTVIYVDLRSELSTLGDLGSPSMTVTKNEVSGTAVANLQHFAVTIAARDGTIAEKPLSDVDVPPNSTSVELPLLISTGELLDYLKEGSVALHLYATGTLPTQPITLTHTLDAHVAVAVHKSLL
ncbi:MAG: hypothetical protein ABTD50_21110 [Polyangiaceae bacterium]|jgi:hypothetical protein